MIRAQLKNIYYLNTGKKFNNHLRQRFQAWHMNIKWIPDHLANKDKTHVYCNSVFTYDYINGKYVRRMKNEIEMQKMQANYSPHTRGKNTP